MSDLTEIQAAQAVKVIGSDASGVETNPVGVTSENRIQAQTKIVGHDGLYHADVELSAGKRRLLTDATVTVEELFGRDPQGTTYFYINTQYDVGSMALNDTVRVQIAVGPDATLFPAIDVTTTVNASVMAAANKETALADLIVNTLNANGTFSAQWKAQRIKDFSGVFIASKLFNEWGERLNPGDFSVTTTGTVTVTLGFSDIERRGFSTELSRSPNDPRQGILAISGTVAAVPGSAGDLYIENTKNAGSSNLRVNGSSTPVSFVIPINASKSIFLNEIRFYGGGNGIQFEKFLSQSGTGLTNGIRVRWKSDNAVFTMPLIRTTEDFKNKFAFGGADNFSVDIQAGADQFLACFIPEISIVLKKTGTFGSGNDDYLEVLIQDNLTAGLAELECIARGFLKEE